jgi:hypothetical protein
MPGVFLAPGRGEIEFLLFSSCCHFLLLHFISNDTKIIISLNPNIRCVSVLKKSIRGFFQILGDKMEVKKAYKLEVDEELRVEVDCPKNEKVWNVYKNGGGIKNAASRKRDRNVYPGS